MAKQKNQVKLTYDTANQRFQKIVKGKKWRSSRGLLPTETSKAIKELEQWLKDQEPQPEPEPSSGFLDLLEVQMQQQQYINRLIEADQPKNAKTHSEAITQFLEFKKPRVKYSRLQVLSAHLKTWFVGQAGQIGIASLDRDKWESMMDLIQTNINQNKWSTKYANDLMSSIRGYYKWLYESERIDLIPRFVNSSIFSVTVLPSTPEYFADAELQKVFKCSNDQFKLWYLLALNCGMTQIDISELTWDQIDLKNGTLKRKRTKHEHRDSERIPTVVYKLFPEIVAALSKLGSREGRVFNQRNGNALVQEGRNDQIAKAFRPIKAEAGSKLSFKHFRKTGVTWISADHKAWRETYLANVPTGVTDKNYDGTTELPVSVTDTIRSKLQSLKLTT